MVSDPIGSIVYASSFSVFLGWNVWRENIQLDWQGVLYAWAFWSIGAIILWLAEIVFKAWRQA